jgi:ditrans,polycis-polyprenyl diphosphate synthase
MSWFIDDRRTWTQKCFGNIIKTGLLPKHVAIIMDGNRRYARINQLKQIQGHISGFDKLAEVCVCLERKDEDVFKRLFYSCYRL